MVGMNIDLETFNKLGGKQQMSVIYANLIEIKQNKTKRAWYDTIVLTWLTGLSVYVGFRPLFTALWRGFF